ncbi:hypothetical protein PMI23_05850, partial [Pseudomonas sp. GM24]
AAFGSSYIGMHLIVPTLRVGTIITRLKIVWCLL